MRVGGASSVVRRIAWLWRDSKVAMILAFDGTIFDGSDEDEEVVLDDDDVVLDEDDEVDDASEEEKSEEEVEVTGGVVSGAWESKISSSGGSSLTVLVDLEGAIVLTKEMA